METEISLVIGTAGHIDHGKTSLVKAMTGIDCDRLNEEKKRGITIELGFAPLKLDDGRVISLIDVPGHERFIRQMAAGASGIDAALLIVAADEGVMPQTKEHMSILQLLGVRSGLVAMTKTDKVDAEFAELAKDDIRSLLKGTFLENSPIIPVSSITGENIPLLLSEISKLVDEVHPRPRDGELFLPIDRAFPISGFGTVITGTAHRGVIRQDDEIEILPSGLKGRVRNVQVHGKTTGEGWAGQRIAVNISGVSVDDIRRGDVLCAGGIYRSTNCFDASVHVLESSPEAIKHWQRVRLLVGTSDVLARISLPGKSKIEPGADSPAQIFTEENIVCSYSQKFILRFYSPLDTIAGGKVLVPYSKRPSGKKAGEYSEKLLRFSVTDDTPDRLEFITERHGFFSINQASASIQENVKRTLAIAENLEKTKKIFILRDNTKNDDKVFLLSAPRLKSADEEIRAILAEFHAARPMEKGIAVSELSRIFSFKPKLSVKEMRLLLTTLELNAETSQQKNKDDDKGSIMFDHENDCARLSSFAPADDEKHKEQVTRILDMCRARAFQPPLIEEAQEELKCEAKNLKLTLESMKNSGEISVVSGFILSREIEVKLLEIINGINGEITLAAVRDATKSSRKYILPILEYFDAKGITRRVGEIRILRRNV
ncbi:MAG: selenocysteine-specific translation elongation factor [Synergistaceae bacterium]|nr:selenocysteine-specific translation elongation factor [Synergistaceae bacterium]